MFISPFFELFITYQLWAFYCTFSRGYSYVYTYILVDTVWWSKCGKRNNQALSQPVSQLCNKISWIIIISINSDISDKFHMSCLHWSRNYILREIYRQSREWTNQTIYFYIHIFFVIAWEMLSESLDMWFDILKV